MKDVRPGPQEGIGGAIDGAGYCAEQDFGYVRPKNEGWDD